MKKRILSLLLVVAMLAAMVVVPVYAAEGTENSDVEQSTTAATKTDMTQTCPCGCGKTFAEITWTDLDLSTWQTIEEDVSGHYKLTGDCTQTKQTYFNGITSNVVIDLAGAKVTAGNVRNFNVLGASSSAPMSLTIIDSVGGATMSSAYTSGAASVYVKYATVNLYGGTFQCNSGKGGGLYSLAGGVINVYAPTTVYGGDFVSTYGAVAYVNGSGAELNIYGGSLVDGSSVQSDGISINNGTVTIAGGTVGTVKPLNNNATVSISGKAVVENLDLTSGAGTVSISNLDETASIGIDAEKGAVNATIDDVQTYFEGGNISSGMSYADLSLDEGVLTMSDSICPHCDKAYSDITWTAWTNDLSANFKPSGDTNHYYLTSSLIGKSTKIYSGGGDSDTNVSDFCIDMRGFHYTTTSGNLYVYKNQKLAVCDSLGGAILEGKTSNSKSTVSSVYVSSGGTLKLYDIEITNNQTTVKDGTEVYKTDADTGEVTYYAPTKGLLTLVSSAKLEAENCTFNASAAYYGGVLYMDKTTSSATFTDCVLNGCNVTTNGSAVYASYGTLELNNSTINGAAAGKHGGTIYAPYGKISILGGTVTNGSAGSDSVDGYGGNIYVSSGTLTIRNAVISEGTSSSRGGNIYATGAGVTIENSQIIGGTVTSGSGGSIYLTGSGSSLTASGSSFIGGSCSGNGGTFYAASTDFIAFTNCQFEGGTCGNYGGIMFAQCKMSFEGCTGISGSADADGDLTYPTNGIYNGTASLEVSIKDCDFEEVTIKSNATMSGEVNIANYWPMNTTTTANISELSTDSRITVYGKSGSTITAALADDAAAQAYLDAGTFTSGNELILEVQGAQIVAVEPPAERYCPHCDTTVAFNPYIHTGADENQEEFTESGHYYLVASASVSSEAAIGKKDNTETVEIETEPIDVVIDLNGKNIKSDNRAFAVRTGCSLYLMDSVGGATVKGGYKSNVGAVIHGTVGSKVTLHGGTYTQYARSEGSYTRNGGIIYVIGGELIVENDAVVTGGTTTANGGNIYITSGTKTDENGTVEIKGKLTIKDTAQINGGSATSHGGNIYAGDSTVIIQGNAQVTGGFSEYRGGNIHGNNSAVELSGNAIVSGGEASDGGNMFLYNASSLTMTGGTIKDGVAKDHENNGASTYGRGGNLYLGAGEHTISGGTISGGTSAADNLAKEFGGGNIYLYSGGTLTVSGGTISGGNSGTYGGNIYSIGALVLNNGSISGGSAVNSGADIYIGDTGSISVSENITGVLGMGFHDDKFDGTTAYGSKVLDSACTTLNATMTLDGVRGNVPMYAQDGALWVQDGGVAIEKLDGTMEYYADPDEAVAAFNPENDSWIVVCGAKEIPVTNGLWIDVNGCEAVKLTSTEGATINCIDSANEDYKTFGYVTLDGAVLGNDSYVNANGTTYITVEENGQYSFHALDMKIVAVSLKTKTGGLYYDAVWYCDDTVKGQIDTFGIAANLGAIPTELIEDQYSWMNGTELVSGKTFVGATINGIIGSNEVKDENGEVLTNEARGAVKLYAAPYVILENYGEVIISTIEVGVSLRDCCDLIDDMITEKLAADPNDADAANYINYMNNYLFTDEVDFATGKAGWAGLVSGWQGTFTNFFQATTTEETT